MRAELQALAEALWPRVLEDSKLHGGRVPVRIVLHWRQGYGAGRSRGGDATPALVTAIKSAAGAGSIASDTLALAASTSSTMGLSGSTSDYSTIMDRALVAGSGGGAAAGKHAATSFSLPLLAADRTAGAQTHGSALSGLVPDGTPLTPGVRALVEAGSHLFKLAVGSTTNGGLQVTRLALSACYEAKQGDGSPAAAPARGQGRLNFAAAAAARKGASSPALGSGLGGQGSAPRAGHHSQQQALGGGVLTGQQSIVSAMWQRTLAQQQLQQLGSGSPGRSSPPVYAGMMAPHHASFNSRLNTPSANRHPCAKPLPHLLLQQTAHEQQQEQRAPVFDAMPAEEVYNAQEAQKPQGILRQPILPQRPSAGIDRAQAITLAQSAAGAPTRAFAAAEASSSEQLPQADAQGLRRMHAQEGPEEGLFEFVEDVPQPLSPGNSPCQAGPGSSHVTPSLAVAASEVKAVAAAPAAVALPDHTSAIAFAEPQRGEEAEAAAGVGEAAGVAGSVSSVVNVTEQHAATHKAEGLQAAEPDQGRKKVTAEPEQQHHLHPQQPVQQARRKTVDASLICCDEVADVVMISDSDAEDEQPLSPKAQEVRDYALALQLQQQEEQGAGRTLSIHHKQPAASRVSKQAASGRGDPRVSALGHQRGQTKGSMQGSGSTAKGGGGASATSRARKGSSGSGGSGGGGAGQKRPANEKVLENFFARQPPVKKAAR